MKRKYVLVIAVFVIAALGIVPAVFAAAPTGAGPNDPLSGDNTWRTVPANGALWYYFDYFGDKSPAQVAADTNAVPNIALAVFTADQARQYVQDPSTAPTGWGTPPGAQTQVANHDLIWSGGFNFGGRFYAVVFNKNPNPVSVRVSISGLSLVTLPTPTPTPPLVLPNPFATPVMTGTVTGRLVFQDASGGNIYTVNGDGSGLQRVTYGLDPRWSPNGTKIAFSRWNDPAGAYIADANGGNQQLIYGAKQLLSPEWSPDGTRLAFTRQSGGNLTDSQRCRGDICITIMADPHWKLGVADILTGTLTDPPGSLHAFSPTWSTDNKTLAFADAQFGILSTDTTSQTTNTVVNLFTDNPDVQSSVFSPDGQKIAFMVRQSDHYEINWTTWDGKIVQAVTSQDPLSFKAVNSIAPTWSPDGKQILFLSDRNGKWEFFVANLDGSGLKQVLKNVTDSIAIRYNFSNERVIDWTR